MISRFLGANELSYTFSNLHNFIIEKLFEKQIYFRISS